MQGQLLLLRSEFELTLARGEVVAQINFFMADADRRDFHDYVFSRGGYITPCVSASPSARILRNSADGDVASGICSIFLEAVHPSAKLQPAGWPLKRRSPFLTPYTGGFYVQGPAVEYLPSTEQLGGIVRGRLYVLGGGVPGRHQPDGSIIALDGQRVSSDAASEAKSAMDRFYRAIAAHIRKHYRNDGGWFHGPQSDELQSKGVPKYQAIVDARPVPMPA